MGSFPAARGLPPENHVEGKRVDECRVPGQRAARLACYDALFRDATPGEVAGAVVISSEQRVPAQPTGREPATLTISCIEGQAVVSFAFAGQSVSNTGDIAPVTYQVDSNATAVRTMRANADNTELTFASARETETFLDSLVGGTRVKVRMTPVRQRSLTVDFRIATAIEEIAALRASCGG